MLLAQALSTGSLVFLALAVGLALSFEFVNGFHDTANAVATVIYTHTLRPWVAVIWSGCWNLIGVLTSTGGIAFTILALLPVELIVNIGSGPGFAMVFALLIAAIIWNIGTWYLGLPASSSHTLIGAIMGVGLANALMSPGHTLSEGVNWAEVAKVFKSLLLSPLVGFVAAALLLLLAKAVLSHMPELFKAPPKDAPPPFWIRCLLVLTCTGVSFAHGSNDGQKGMGLILLILIGILPGMYALNPHLKPEAVNDLRTTAISVEKDLDAHAAGTTIPADAAAGELSAYLKSDGVASPKTFAAVAFLDHRLADSLAGKHDFSTFSVDDRKTIRTEIYLVSTSLGKLIKQKKITDPAEKITILGNEEEPGIVSWVKGWFWKKDAHPIAGFKPQLDRITLFVPDWVKVAVAVSLGLGTMIGWKRIVTTVGEKIGKDHLTYAQGASAELVAMVTIIAADQYHLPVSTTHVLSSGVAGTMAANHSGLQLGTLRNLALAWILTLPVCVLLGAGAFAGGLYIVLHNLVTLTVIIGGVCMLVGAGLLFRRIMAIKSVDAHSPALATE